MKKHERLIYHNFLLRVLPLGFTIPRLIHIGQPIGINWVLRQIEKSGHRAIDKIEGAIWRVEHKSKFDFIVKFVRPDKQDGIYLPEISNQPPIWNCNPSNYCE